MVLQTFEKNCYDSIAGRYSRHGICICYLLIVPNGARELDVVVCGDKILHRAAPNDDNRDILVVMYA